MHKYEEFRENLISEKLYKKLNDYRQHLNEVVSNNEFIEGVNTVSKIISVAQTVLDEQGLKYIWLVPIESSINEYSENNFIAYNPCSKKSYALVQSPQIQKQSAAILMGSNYRIATCYRGEKCDEKHSQIFQQLDVEFKNRTADEIRAIAEKIILGCIKEILKEDIGSIDQYRYSDLIELYGEDEPNLFWGLKIVFFDGEPVINLSNVNDFYKVRKLLSDLSDFKIVKDNYGNRVIMCCLDESKKIESLRLLRRKLIEIGVREQRVESQYLYWIHRMPYAEKKNNKLMPLHHIMTLPILAKKDDSFSFSKLSENELLSLECESFDLILCNERCTAEVLGGDERINSFSLQLDAIKRFGYSEEQYAFLLELLHFNEISDNPCTLGGFAIGIERLANMFLGLNDMKYVQLFPTNSIDSELIHAISIEEQSKPNYKAINYY